MRSHPRDEADPRRSVLSSLSDEETLARIRDVLTERPGGRRESHGARGRKKALRRRRGRTQPRTRE